MKLHLKIWRQDNPETEGSIVDYELDGVSEHMSFLEMLDLLNEKLIGQNERVIEFDHDCREGICGQCGVTINGRPHGPLPHTTTCQLHMRTFHDNDTLLIEPFRAGPFSILRDLKIDRSAFDRIIQSGGYISANTGQAPEANSLPIGHHVAESAFDSAACIGCGACVASCTNASAALFTSAKISHLGKLPQGVIEQTDRVKQMVNQMDSEGFGNCSNTGACAVECPQQITLENIAQMNREYFKAIFWRR